jgi:feruloyl esterase
MPGLGHGTPNGTANPSASPPNFGQNQVYELITNWVEKKAPPGELTLNSPGGVAKALPACLYPKMVKYVQGDPANSQSYACR